MPEKPIKERADEYLRRRMDGEDGIAALVKKAETGDDQALQTITEYPLSAEVVKHYEILLGTGGPADRITGKLDEHNEPETARYQFQDWGEPWTDATLSVEDEGALLSFARQFFFAE